MIEFDDREDDILNLVDLVRPQKREKEPQEEYRIPPRVRTMRNRLQIAYREHADVSALQAQAHREREKLLIRINFCEQEIRANGERMEKIERKVRQIKGCLKEEMRNL